MQQSAFATHAAPVGWQTQLPPLHVMRPQQSDDVVHRSFSSEQQRMLVGEGRHELSAAQHWVAIEHALPDAMQPELPPHTPPVHV